MSTNNPDKIIFVGEALVGNEAVDQLTKFDRALRDFSSAAGGAGKERGIDGMLVTKWDTVDDKVSCEFHFASLEIQHLAILSVNIPNFLFPLVSCVSTLFANRIAFGLLGGSRALNDICDWTTYHLRWMRAGTLLLSLDLYSSDEFLVFPLVPIILSRRHTLIYVN